MPSSSTTAVDARASTRAELQRLLWALEHVLLLPDVPLASKLNVLKFVKRASGAEASSAFDEELARRGALGLVKCAERTKGFTTLTASSASHCADDLCAYSKRRDANPSLAARAREIAERAKAEYAFGQLRLGRDGFGASPVKESEARRGKASPVKQWRLVENFWLRWNDVRASDMFAEDGKKLVGSKTREAYVFVEGAKKKGGKLPGSWETVVEDPAEILDAMGELFEDAVATFGKSFLSLVVDDIQSGAYKVTMKKGLITDSGRVNASTVEAAMQRNSKVRERLAMDALEQSGDMFASPPKKVHIAAERKANARTVEWNSQPDEGAAESPEQLATLPWDGFENTQAERTPRKRVSSPDPKSPPRNGKQLRWTDVEVQALIRGVEKYGVGKWSYIMKDPTMFADFHPRRTSVDLKDKWRVIAPKMI